MYDVLEEAREMSDRQSSAVVLGASMSGLLAARALSRHFERITDCRTRRPARRC